MAFYYGKNKLGNTDVKLSELYELKGVNMNTDKTTNMRLSAVGSTTEGAHLGPGINYWQSIYNGWSSSDDRLGLDGMNSPNNNTPVGLSWIRNADWKWTPFIWGDGKNGYTAYPDSLTSAVNIYDSVSTPFWALANYFFFYFYAMDRPTVKLMRPSAHYITGVRRTISSTNYIYVAVGKISADSTNSGGFGTISAPSNTANFAAVNGVLGPLNLGMGEGAPYNESSDLGGSTQHALFYRNTSNANKVRVVTTNTDYTTSNPTVSIGSEQGGTNHGNPIPGHGVLNMGKGTAWAGYHRGASYQRVQYVNWTSGTTFSTIGSTNLRSMSSSTTLQGTGHMIKISDEFALWFYPRRSGNTSGAARLIAVIPIYSNGTNKVPTLRGGTTEIATYDIGSISTQDCSAAVGSSDRQDTVFGIVCWAESSSGNNAMNIMSWEYDIANNSMTFHTGTILTLSTSLTGANSYRMKTGVKCLGYNGNENKNYYMVLIPQGDSAGGGANQVIIEQDAIATNTGTLSATLTQADYFNDTTVRLVAQPCWYDYAQDDNRGWYMGYSGTIPNPGRMGMIYPYVDSNNVAKIRGVEWEVSV